MKPEKPVHFVEWKKISDADFISTVRKLAEWGVRNIVAHPQWGMRDMEEPGYLHSVMEELKRAGLALLPVTLTGARRMISATARRRTSQKESWRNMPFF